MAVALRLRERQGGEWGVPEGDRATDPHVWDDVAHVLMNVKGFIL